MSEQNLVEQIQDETDDIIQLLKELVERESPTPRKDLVDRVAIFVADYLRQSGLNPQLVGCSEVGDMVWSEWDRPAQGRILVLCHLDTVWEEGSLRHNPFRIEDGRIYGPGIFDMKSGVAATLRIQQYLARGWIKPRRRVRFLYTTDEETTGLESRPLIEDFARHSDLVLVTEPPLPGGQLKTFRKGVGQYRVRVYGKPAHAGLDPEKGANAVEEMARQILEIHSLACPEKGTTVSVNVVRGGTASNVIAEYAEALVDARFRTVEEGERADRELKRLKPHRQGVQVELEGGIDRPPMIRTRRSEELFATARRIAGELGICLEEGESGGASDGNITAALGIPTLDGLGVTGDGAHAWHEHIQLSALVPRIALLARLIERL